MLLKINRIPRPLFPLVMKKGKKYSSNNLFARVVWLEEEHRDDPIRCSFVVSAKVSKSAVARHRLKRLGYAIVRRNLHNTKKGVMVALFFTPTAADVPKNKLEAEIEELLHKTGVYEK